MKFLENDGYPFDQGYFILGEKPPNFVSWKGKDQDMAL